MTMTMLENISLRIMWGLINFLARVRPYTICAGCMADPHGHGRGMTVWALIWRWARDQCPGCGRPVREVNAK